MCAHDLRILLHIMLHIILRILLRIPFRALLLSHYAAHYVAHYFAHSLCFFFFGSAFRTMLMPVTKLAVIIASVGNSGAKEPTK